MIKSDNKNYDSFKYIRISLNILANTEYSTVINAKIVVKFNFRYNLE